MTNVRPTLDRVWDSLRKASVVDDLAIVEYIAALLIEGKDWYEWGYRIILEHQKPDGSWQDKHQPEVDTCFALLFLKRANLAKDLTDKLRELLRLSGIPAGPVPAAPQGQVPRGSDTPGKRST